MGLKAGLYGTGLVIAVALAMFALTILPGILQGFDINVSGPIVNVLVILALGFPVIGYIFGVFLSIYMYRK